MRNFFFIKLIVIIMLQIACSSKRQLPKSEQDLFAIIEEDSKAYAEGFLKQDANLIVHYTNEAFVLDKGGKDAYLKEMQRDCREFKARNDKILDIAFSKPDSIMRIENRLVCVLKLTGHESFGLTGDQSYEISNAILANSNDSGYSWKFLGLFGLEEDKIKAYVPGFSYQRFGIEKKVKEKQPWD
ncbi:MAG: hypothetical protein CFE21_10145 [Bacteroidetes bacterium B1(2017)]|nr:MAG: hypothetical protein CFE21_10145 [Bacteroidetes bacterium B1(2017)]